MVWNLDLIEERVDRTNPSLIDRGTLRWEPTCQCLVRPLSKAIGQIRLRKRLEDSTLDITEFQLSVQASFEEIARFRQTTENWHSVHDSVGMKSSQPRCIECAGQLAAPTSKVIGHFDLDAGCKTFQDRAELFLINRHGATVITGCDIGNDQNPKSQFASL